MSRASDQIGRSQLELLRFTELTQKAIQASGATTREAATGVVQLGQALASGQLRGDDLRSVLENLSGVAIEMAAGLHEMGVASSRSVNEMRVLAEQGRLTGEMIVEAILRRSDQIEARFASMPVTVEAGPFVMSMKSASYDAILVEGELGFEDTLAAQFPADTFSPSMHPGLF